MYTCSGVTCHLHCWQNVRDLLRATAVTVEWKRYQMLIRAQAVNPGEENSPGAPATFAGKRTCNLAIKSQTLYQLDYPDPLPPWTVPN